MGIFGLFGRKPDIKEIAKRCASDINSQIDEARPHYSSQSELMEELGSPSVLAFLHGYILEYADNTGLQSPQEIWALNVETFSAAFQAAKANELILSLQNTLRGQQHSNWIKEGKDAAMYGKKQGVTLLAAFLKGMAK